MALPLLIGLAAAAGIGYLITNEKKEERTPPPAPPQDGIYVPGYETRITAEKLKIGALGVATLTPQMGGGPAIKLSGPIIYLTQGAAVIQVAAPVVAGTSLVPGAALVTNGTKLWGKT